MNTNPVTAGCITGGYQLTNTTEPAFGQAQEFEVYEDNRFGTFLFQPLPYTY